MIFNIRNMKSLAIIFLVVLFNNGYGQTFPALEKVLMKELSESSHADGRWVFYADKANIQKIIKPAVKAKIPSYEFFQMNLTNYLGWHVNEGTCLVLFDSSKSKILLVEPLWYQEPSQGLLNLFKGKSFNNKDSLLNFLKELHELMEVGSGFKFVNTGFSDSVITYDMGYFRGDSYTTGGNGVKSTVRYNEDGIWRKIRIDIKNLAIIRYSAINPKE